MSESAIQVRIVVKGLKRFKEAVQRAQLSVSRLYDAYVDAGLAEPPPGYWNQRLAREVAWRSIPARVRRWWAWVVGL